MGFAVVHMMKIKSGAVGGIQSHNNREHQPKTNPDVDMSRSDENYDIVPCDNYNRAIKEKVSNLVKSSRAVRKDAVVTCNFIITSDNETMSNLGENSRAFFEDAVKWFSDRYGADRILNATVHMDETTPHLHLGIVPITQDGRLSAKAIFYDKELKAIQTEFARDVGAKYGLERGVEGSERTHLSVTRYKAKQAFDAMIEYSQTLDTMQQEVFWSNMELEDTYKKLSIARESLSAVTEEISLMESKKDALRGDIAVLESQKQGLEQVSSELSVQIHEAEDELATVQAYIKSEENRGRSSLGMSMGDWLKGISGFKETQLKEKLVRFAEYVISHVPGIREIWDGFENTGKHRSKDKQIGE